MICLMPFVKPNTEQKTGNVKNYVSCSHRLNKTRHFN